MPLYHHLQSWTFLSFLFFILLPLLSLPLPPLSLQLSKWSVLSRYMLFLVEDRSRAWSCTLWEQDLTNLSEGGEWIPPKQTSSVYQSFLNPAGGDITQLMSQSSPLYIRWSKSHHCSADVQYIQGKHEGFKLRPACTLGLQLTEPTQDRCLVLGEAEIYKDLLMKQNLSWYCLAVPSGAVGVRALLFYFLFIKRHSEDHKSSNATLWWCTLQQSSATSLWWIV